jgi:hypothetical protein
LDDLLQEVQPAPLHIKIIEVLAAVGPLQHVDEGVLALIIAQQLDDTEFRIIPRNLCYFRTVYGIYGSNKNMRNSPTNKTRNAHLFTTVFYDVLKVSPTNNQSCI